MTVDKSTQDAIRDKATRLFQFVQAFNERRNPPVRDLRKHEWLLWFKDVPMHDSIELLMSVDEDDDETDAEEGEDAEGYERVILRCTRPDPTDPPTVPSELEPWLGRDWRDPRSDPKPIESKNTTIDDETIVENFEDSGERLNAYADYHAVWLLWAKEERRTLDAADLFGKLFELYGRLQRDPDTYELVLANGILSWQTNFDIYHPVLSASLVLNFDPKVPEFVLRETGTGTGFNYGLFSNVENVDGTVIGKMRAEVAELGLHPLGNGATPGFLRSISARLSRDGRYVGDADPGNPTQIPTVGRLPVILLRKRTSGLAQAISAVVAAIKSGGEIPIPLVNIVGVEAQARHAIDGDETSYSRIVDANADENTLFTKPANAEQLMIARALEREDGVLVQGPPGTGKTHTIANLLGHLLAQGKTILVTSQTSKALKVLKGKVTPALHALCVSVVDTVEDDAALKSSIDGIIERIGFSDEPSLERDIDRFQRQRIDLIHKLRGLKNQLKTARLDEHIDIVVGGEPIQPSEAAKLVAAGIGKHDWIPGPASLGSFIPLPLGELARLYATNTEISRDEETTITGELPEIASVVHPTDFADLVREYRALESVGMDRTQHLWREPDPDHRDADALETAYMSVREALKVIDPAAPWAMELVEVGLVGSDVALWQSLVADLEKFHAETATVKHLLVAYQPQTAKRLDNLRAEAVYSALAAEVKRTGKVPGFIALLGHTDWKIALEESRVEGDARPRSREHFLALAAQAALDQQRKLLMRRWANQVVAIGGPELSEDDFADAALRQLTAIRVGLGWADTHWTRVLSQLQQCGLDWAGLLSESAYEHAGLSNIERIRSIAADFLPDILASERQRRRWAAVGSSLADLRQSVKTWSTSGLPGTLVSAISHLDETRYTEAYGEIVRLRSLEGKVRERRELVARLESLAPGWADAIRNRVGVHGSDAPPGDLKAAWIWRQYNDELERRWRFSLPDIVRQIDAVTAGINEATIGLVDRRAWLHQKRRTTLKERNALFGFAVAKRQYGKGTGKRAARQLAEQRRLMSEARTAVPVWIMSINKAVEVFKPEEIPFDVVIIDEASQSDVTSLVALYLGRQVLVVGDDEQVSPADVGQSVEVTQQLIDLFLEGIPNRQQYTGQLSLYDIAKWSFGGAITLLEHFRSVPDIIRFSNELSYGGKIKPLREVTEFSPTPSVTEYRVDGYRSGDINELEAKSIVALIKACTEEKIYDGMSIGIISLLADSQARYIEQLLYRVLSAEEITRRRIVAGNAAQFQGDERDVMFLSLVQTADGIRRVDSRPYQQRFNVAASRARDQMWVVHSLNPATDLTAGDLRRKLIEHAQDPMALVRVATEAISRAESPFEREIIKRLAGAGYRITSNHPVGSYRIDIVVRGVGPTKLAIECDGARYHGSEELEYDMQRQADLERLGWRFERIRGTAFYKDGDAAMAPVFQRLSAMGIEPLEFDPDVVIPQPTTDLFDRVKVRAQEILAEIEQELQSGPGMMLLKSARGRPRKFARAGTVSVTDDHQGYVERRDADRIGNGQLSMLSVEKPAILYRDNIDHHITRDLTKLTQWLCSQQHLHSAEELARAVASELGYQRFGAKIANRLMPLARKALKSAMEAKTAGSYSQPPPD